MLFAGLVPERRLGNARQRRLDAHPDVLTPERLLRQGAKDNPLPYDRRTARSSTGRGSLRAAPADSCATAREETQQAAVSALGTSHAPEGCRCPGHRFISAPESESDFAAPLSRDCAHAVTPCGARDERVIGILVDQSVRGGQATTATGSSASSSRLARPPCSTRCSSTRKQRSSRGRRASLRSRAGSRCDSGEKARWTDRSIRRRSIRDAGSAIVRVSD